MRIFFMITKNINNNYVFLNVFMFRIMSMTLMNINPQKEIFHHYDFPVYTTSKYRDPKLDTYRRITQSCAYFCPWRRGVFIASKRWLFCDFDFITDPWICICRCFPDVCIVFSILSSLFQVYISFYYLSMMHFLAVRVVYTLLFPRLCWYTLFLSPLFKSLHSGAQ